MIVRRTPRASRISVEIDGIEQPPPKPSYQGCLQGVGNGHALGWVWDPAAPQERVSVAVVVDGEIVAEAVADIARADLADYGDGAHGFLIALPEQLQAPGRHRVWVLVGARRIPLATAPSFWHEAASGDGWSDVVFEPGEPPPGGALPGKVPEPPAATDRQAVIAASEWLFDAREYEGPLPDPTPAEYDAAVAALSATATRFAELGVSYIPVIVPAKRYIVVIPPVRGRRWLLALNARLRDVDEVELLDLVPVLRNAARHGPTYHRTDADWNDRGAFFVARALLKEAHKHIPALCPPALGDLHLRSVPGYRGTLADVPLLELAGAELVSSEQTVDAEDGVTIDARALRALRMPVEAHLADAGTDHLRVYANPELDEHAHVTIVGDTAALSLVPWLAERARRTSFFWTREPPPTQLELELPQVVFHLIREADLVGAATTAHEPPPAETTTPTLARTVSQPPPPPAAPPGPDASRQPPPPTALPVPADSQQPPQSAAPPTPELTPAPAPPQTPPPVPVAAASDIRVDDALGSAEPDSRWPFALLAAGLFGCGLLLMVLSRHLSFYADEWSFILSRRGWHPSVFLDPHNGHLSLVPVAIYKLLFVAVGIDHSWPYRLVVVVLHLLCVGLIYTLAKRRAGPWIALIPAGLLLLPGAAHEDLLWAFQIGFIGSLAAGLGALLCLERQDRQGDRWAMLLLCVSLACASIGVAFTMGVLALLLVSRSRRPRVWVAVVPLALYGLWYLGYGSSESQVAWANLPSLPRYDTQIGAYGFAGFGGLPIGYGEILLAASVAWLLVRLWRGRALPDGAMVGIVGALVFWSLAGLARAQLGEPGSSRYVYPSIVFILVCLIAFLPESRNHSPRLPPVRAIALVGAGLAFILLGNLQSLRSYAHFRTEFDTASNAELGAELIAHRPSDPYVQATDALGSPALSGSQIMSLSEKLRLKADSIILRIEQPPLRAPVSADLLSAGTPLIHQYRGVFIDEVAVPGAPAKCARLTPVDSNATATLRVASGHTLYLALRGSGAVDVWARRLAHSFGPAPLHTLVSGGSPAIVSFPPDHSRLPWHIRLAPTVPTIVCQGTATA